ncbi:hypothetical protein ABPG74_011298 [Tetrahymena malaccensis]
MILNIFFAIFFINSLLNVDGQPSGSFMTNQASMQDYNNCLNNIKAQNPNPCSTSSNMLDCANNLLNYSSCVLNCIQKTNLSDFKKCVTDCGNTAIASDSSLTTFINSTNSCMSKLSDSTSPITISTPPFVTNKQAAQKFSDCLQNFFTNNLTPCSSSANPNQCQNIQTTYFNCQTQCFLKNNFSEFQSCSNDCGKAATTSDTTLSSYVTGINGCISLMNTSLILISALSQLLFLLLI